MRIIIAIVFILGSATAYLDDHEDAKYFIQNANTEKYMFTDIPTKLPSGIAVARNVCISDFLNRIPDPEPNPNSLFYIVTNNVIGPYYNIITVGSNSTLFASELEVGVEINVTVNKVMAWNDREHLNTPEALWNIRHFRNDLYILNVYYGSYLYTNNDLNSAAVLEGSKRLALLMPSEAAGRVEGTQWYVTRFNGSSEGNSGYKGGVGGKKVTGDEVMMEEKNTGGEEVEVVTGNVTEEKEDGENVTEEGKEERIVGEMENVTKGVEKIEGVTGVQVGNVTEEVEKKDAIEGASENVTEGGEQKEEVKEVSGENVTKEIENEEAESQLENVKEAEEKEDTEKVSDVDAEGKKLRSDPQERKANSESKGFDYKTWALLFNCHTTRRTTTPTTSKYSVWWPYDDRSLKVDTSSVDHSSDWPCPGLVGIYRGKTERDEFEEMEAATTEQWKAGEERVGNVNGTVETEGDEKMEWEKEHKKEKASCKRAMVDQGPANSELDSDNITSSWHLHRLENNV